MFKKIDVVWERFYIHVIFFIVNHIVLSTEYEEAKEWVINSLTFDVPKDVNLFEITIRVLGGMLSSFHLSGETIFKQRAVSIFIVYTQGRIVGRCLSMAKYGQ